MKLVDFFSISNNDYLIGSSSFLMAPRYRTLAAVETYLSETNSNNVTSDILGS
jgi:hypothetical protein